MTDAPTLLDAALGYAARGWPVFPCSPKHKQPLLAAQTDDQGKKIRGTGGVSAASTDPAQIRAWWKKWPKALIGLATGHPTLDAGGRRMFVLDFDPRVDDSTGEIWDLHGLKADFEGLIDCALPESLAGMTPSDGVHLYLLQDNGDPVRNSASKFTEHVDVRGLGGYVIAPPSVMGADAIKGQGGLRYRWHRQAPIADAPAQLLTLLRERRGKAAERPSEPRTSAAGQQRVPVSSSERVRRYALTALDGELQAVRTAGSGKRNAQLNESAFKIAALVAGGALDSNMARFSLEAAARDNPGNDDDRQLQATIDSGWSAGLGAPRDLADIEAAARERSDRRPSSSGSRDRAPAGGPRPFQPSAAPAAGGGAGQGGPFRNGSTAHGQRPGGAGEDRVLTPADRVRLRRIGDAWLKSRLQTVEHDAAALKVLAWNAGRRNAAGAADLFEAAAGIMRLANAAGLTDLRLADVGAAIEEGRGRGFDVAPLLTDLQLANYPMTDFGIAERFRDRHGHQFRFTTAKGWLGWDGRRWKVLDQDQDTAPAELVAAVFETIRDVQREARRVRETGLRWELRKQVGPKGGISYITGDGLGEDPDLAAVDHWVPKGNGFVRFSDLLAGWGRQSEAAGKPVAIANLSRRWLTVAIEDFDCEQMAINVLNGTLRLIRHPAPPHANPDARWQVEVRLDPHNRDDLITKLAPVEYDRDAAAPLYDGMIAWAHPDPAMRRYVHQVGGYACTGDTGQHLLWFNYGRGRNGKSVTIDSWSAAIGDYSGTIGIESFLDQGIKKRGDAATPDLAKLGGVRLLRASEPERGAKLNSALIKAATGGEPMSVRALHRGFFDLLPRFKLLMSGNSKPSIPDTDEGIWGRMKLVPWLRHIEKPHEDPYATEFPCPEWPAKDPALGQKIKDQELPGVFARLVVGLVDFLEHGFVEPERVTLATADYRNQSDPLARFLSLCTVSEAGSRVKSSELHEVFAAWCKAAGEKEWSAKGFSDALQDKGFTKVRSDGMRWEGLKLVRSASEFVDENGRVLAALPDLDREPAALAAAPAASRASFQGDDDDLPIL